MSRRQGKHGFFVQLIGLTLTLLWLSACQRVCETTWVEGHLADGDDEIEDELDEEIVIDFERTEREYPEYEEIELVEEDELEEDEPVPADGDTVLPDGDHDYEAYDSDLPESPEDVNDVPGQIKDYDGRILVEKTHQGYWLYNVVGGIPQARYYNRILGQADDDQADPDFTETSVRFGNAPVHPSSVWFDSGDIEMAAYHPFNTVTSEEITPDTIVLRAMDMDDSSIDLDFWMDVVPPPTEDGFEFRDIVVLPRQRSVDTGREVLALLIYAAPAGNGGIIEAPVYKLRGGTSDSTIEFTDQGISSRFGYSGDLPQGAAKALRGEESILINLGDTLFEFDEDGNYTGTSMPFFLNDFDARDVLIHSISLSEDGDTVAAISQVETLTGEELTILSLVDADLSDEPFWHYRFQHAFPKRISVFGPDDKVLAVNNPAREISDDFYYVDLERTSRPVYGMQLPYYGPPLFVTDPLRLLLVTPYFLESESDLLLFFRYYEWDWLTGNFAVELD